MIKGTHTVHVLNLV